MENKHSNNNKMSKKTTNSSPTCTGFTFDCFFIL